MRTRHFQQVDVFTAVPFRGNPVAVILEADGLDTAQMQQIARWTNLSETTFVLPPTIPGADYLLRIFTPGAELPFAGHPTLGSAHALLESGRVRPRDGLLVQQCGAGLVSLWVNEGPGMERSIAFQVPSPTLTPLTKAQLSTVERILRQPLSLNPEPCVVDVGPRWIIAQLPDAASVLSLKPDLTQLRDLSLRNGVTGLTVFGAYPEGSDIRIETRSFAPAHGVDEDPVCGSGNGCVAAFIQRNGLGASLGTKFVATQGQVLGRDGRVHLDLEGDRIWIGGNAVTCIEGILRA